MREIQIKKRRKQLEKERKEMEKEQKKLAKKNKKEKKEQNKEARLSMSALPNKNCVSSDNVENSSNKNLTKSKSEGFISKNNDEKQSSSESVNSVTSKKRISKGFKSRIKSLLDFKSRKN